MIKIHPWKIFSHEKCWPSKNVHPRKIFTLETCSPSKHIHHQKIFPPEKFSPLKNIHPWKIFTPEKYHHHHLLTIFYNYITIKILPSPSRRHHLAITLRGYPLSVIITLSPSRCHPLELSPSQRYEKKSYANRPEFRLGWEKEEDVKMVVNNRSSDVMVLMHRWCLQHDLKFLEFNFPGAVQFCQIM